MLACLSIDKLLINASLGQYDPAIQLLGIYPKELKAGSHRDICTPVFIASLFTIAKKWKQPVSITV